MDISELAPRRDEDDRVRNPGGAMRVALFTGDDVATIAAAASLREVADQLVARDVGLLVVGSADHVEGVVSERDLVRAIAEGGAPDTTSVRDVIHTGIVWCDVTATVDEVAEMMMEHYVRHVLIEDGGRLVGIVSARDLLGAYAWDPE